MHILVVLIVAASLVAVETDVEETISAAKVAFVCGLWSVGVVALLSVGPFPYLCIHQLLFPCLEVLAQSDPPPLAVSCMVLPGLGVDVECFHVSLPDIPAPQLRAAFGSPSRCQLSVKNVFWDAAILHAIDMPPPMQPALSEQGEHAWKVVSGQDLGVGVFVLPGYAQDTADASQMEGIESFFLSGIIYVVHVWLPYISVLTTQTLFTTILVFTVNLGLVHTREVRRASVVSAFPILINLSVQGEVVSDGGADICELFNDIELIVIDGDGWQFHCILPQDVCLLQTNG